MRLPRELAGEGVSSCNRHNLYHTGYTDMDHNSLLIGKGWFVFPHFDLYTVSKPVFGFLLVRLLYIRIIQEIPTFFIYLIVEALIFDNPQFGYVHFP